MQNSKYDVIIIGSGIGGLATGLTLHTQNPEIRSLILEQHSLPGGYVSGFKRQGYYFDSGAEGLVYCGKDHTMHNALEFLGVDQEFLRIDPVEVIRLKDMTITMHGNVDKYESELKTNFPHNKSEVETYFAVLRSMHQEYHSIVKGRFDPSLAQLIKIIFKAPTLRKYGIRSFKALLDEHITNPDLRRVLAIYSLWLGIPPSEISAASAAIIFSSPFLDGHYYPKGGMLAFAQNLAQTYEDKGGEIMYRKKVTKILVQRKKAKGVVLADGTEIKANWIVSNADLKRTILDYTGFEHFPASYLKRVGLLKQSVSGFVVFLGLDIHLKDIPSHIAYNVDAETYIDTVLSGEYDPQEVLIRIPDKIDPSLRNEKGSSVILLNIAPYNWEDKWKINPHKKRNQAYLDLKEKYADKLIALAEHVIPNLSKHIVLKEIGTPLTYERYSLNTEGAWYGPRLDQKKMKAKTPIRNLILAGANVAGAGVPTSFFAGVDAGTSLAKKIKKRHLVNLSVSHMISKDSLSLD